MSYCGAKTRSGGKCKQPAMQNGRCRIHGGKTPHGVDSPHFKHGRLSKYATKKLSEHIAAFQQTNALELNDELATQRAMLAEYMHRFEDMSMTRDDISTVMNWFDSVGRMAERINKMRNDDTLTAVEVAALQTRAVDLVMRYFDDPATRKQFLIDLFGISESIDANGVNYPELVTGT